MRYVFIRKFKVWTCFAYIIIIQNWKNPSKYINREHTFLGTERLVTMDVNTLNDEDWNVKSCIHEFHYWTFHSSILLFRIAHYGLGFCFVLFPMEHNAHPLMQMRNLSVSRTIDWNVWLFFFFPVVLNFWHSFLIHCLFSHVLLLPNTIRKHTRNVNINL